MMTTEIRGAGREVGLPFDGASLCMSTPGSPGWERGTSASRRGGIGSTLREAGESGT
jgi:hypothetical protein